MGKMKRMPANPILIDLRDALSILDVEAPAYPSIAAIDRILSTRVPIVDAVEVVRCKDCAYRGKELKCPMCFSEYFDSFETDYGMDCTVTDNTTDDGFCHKGAKMDKEEE